MTRKHLRRYIEARKGNTNSTDDQEKLIMMMYSDGIKPSGAEKKQSELEQSYEDDLEHNLDTVLNHVEDIDLTNQRQPEGPEHLAFGEASEGVILGRVTEVWRGYTEALIEHIQDADPADDEATAVADGGVTLRGLVAQRLDVGPEHVETALRETFDDDDDESEIKRLNDAVTAVKESADFEVRDDEYGEITFTRQAFRYRITDLAVALIEMEEEE